ncbi:MAG: twin-arginine translocase subunit TatC, partial [Bacteroidales bacterium]
AFVFGNILFVLGVFVGYIVVFPLTLRFLIQYELSPLIENQLSLDSYMSNFLTMIFLMGIFFELPLLSMFLSKIGVLRCSFFNKYRRHAIVFTLIAAAFITPSGDPFTLLVVFLPLYLLWELSAVFVKKDS